MNMGPRGLCAGELRYELFAVEEVLDCVFGVEANSDATTILSAMNDTN